MRRQIMVMNLWTNGHNGLELMEEMPLKTFRSCNESWRICDNFSEGNVAGGAALGKQMALICWRLGFGWWCMKHHDIANDWSRHERTGRLKIKFSLDMTSMTTDLAFINEITWLSAECALLARGPMVAGFKEASASVRHVEECIAWKTWNEEENVRSVLEAWNWSIDTMHVKDLQRFAPLPDLHWWCQGDWLCASCGDHQKGAQVVFHDLSTISTSLAISTMWGLPGTPPAENVELREMCRRIPWFHDPLHRLRVREIDPMNPF